MDAVLQMSKKLTVSNITVIMEGDISDVELELSDEELDTFESDEAAAVMTEDISIEDIGLDVEVKKHEIDDEFDVPLVQQFEKQPDRGSTFQWLSKDIGSFPVECDVIFLDPTPEIMSPYSYFRMFIDDSLLDNLVYQTNLYSMKNNGASINTNKTEIEKFLGIYLLSGIVQMPSSRMYWHNATRYAPIADTISEDRFDSLMNTLHINNNDNMKPRDHPEYDHLFKIRPFIECLKTNFAKVEQEEPNLIDVIIIPFNGSNFFKTMKRKLRKWGIKVFVRAGASGIIYDFEIYRGKGSGPSFMNSNLGVGLDDKTVGGGKLNDMLVSFCRSRIKVKRYYLRVFFHFLDIAVANSWLLYRQHCRQRKEKNCALFVDFRCDIAKALLQAGKLESRSRGRSASPSSSNEQAPKRKARAPRPVEDVRYDGVAHWPLHSYRKQRCKKCINNYSRTFCGKCNIALCLNKDRNCFLSFHTR